MRFESSTIESWSHKTGFRPSALAKCAVLTDVLGEITLDPFLESRLAVKGESAILLLGGDPARLPQSLELHYVGDNAWKAFVADRAEILTRLDLIGREFGMIIVLKDFQDRTTFEFSWETPLRQLDTLSIEINWRDRTAIHETMRRVVWTPIGNGAFNALSLSEAEQVAYAAKEALGQVSARALHDLVILQNRAGSDWANEEMKKTFALIGSTLPRPLLSYSPERMRFVSQRDIEGSLYPAMKLGESMRSVGLVSQAQGAVAKLMDFGRDERSYLETLDLGHFEPEILFPRRKDLAEQLQRVPAYGFKGVGARKVLTHSNSESQVAG